MGNRPPERQSPLFIATGSLAQSPGHPFYERMNALFAEEGFDRFVEDHCARFFTETIGRPGTPPGCISGCSWWATSRASAARGRSPDRGRRSWKDNDRARDAVHGNRRRIRSAHGQALRRKRGEIAERSNAHCYETGGLRRVHVRGQENAGKRVLIQAATYNLALLMRTPIGSGTPKGLASRLAAALGDACGLNRLRHALATHPESIVAALERLDPLVRRPLLASLAA